MTATNTQNAKRPNAVAKQFGSKKELIEKVKAFASTELWVDHLNDDKGWNSISNKKLVRLHSIFTKAKERFSSRTQIIDAIVAAEGRAKDGDYKKHFAAWPLPRLMDRLHSVERAAKRVAAKAKAKSK
jgi:hypothetical protein